MNIIMKHSNIADKACSPATLEDHSLYKRSDLLAPPKILKPLVDCASGLKAHLSRDWELNSNQVQTLMKTLNSNHLSPPRTNETRRAR